ncbi:MAG: hypothetical protein AVDCRST_MAG03-3017, partial [uncultured Rubrobacteraceae bacterium]
GSRASGEGFRGAVGPEPVEDRGVAPGAGGVVRQGGSGGARDQPLAVLPPRAGAQGGRHHNAPQERPDRLLLAGPGAPRRRFGLPQPL